MKLMTARITLKTESAKELIAPKDTGMIASFIKVEKDATGNLTVLICTGEGRFQ